MNYGTIMPLQRPHCVEERAEEKGGLSESAVLLDMVVALVGVFNRRDEYP